MSTYVYLECLDHDPPLRAGAESGQHLYDLPQIQRDIADRQVLTRLNAESEVGLDLGYFRNNTLRFLTAHKKCSLGIRDEYDRPHPAVQPDPTTTPDDEERDHE